MCLKKNIPIKLKIIEKLNEKLKNIQKRTYILLQIRIEELFRVALA